MKTSSQSGLREMVEFTLIKLKQNLTTVLMSLWCEKLNYFCMNKTSEIFNPNSREYQYKPLFFLTHTLQTFTARMFIV